MCSLDIIIFECLVLNGIPGIAPVIKVKRRLSSNLNSAVAAFTVAAHQNKQLLGRDGLLPADLYVQRIVQHFGGPRWKAFLHVPSLLIFTDPSKINEHLDLMAYVGMALSALVLITGCANMVVMFILWVLYHSIVNIGQRW